MNTNKLKFVIMSVFYSFIPICSEAQCMDVLNYNVEVEIDSSKTINVNFVSPQSEFSTINVNFLPPLPFLDEDRMEKNLINKLDDLFRHSTYFKPHKVTSLHFDAISHPWHIRAIRRILNVKDIQDYIYTHNTWIYFHVNEGLSPQNHPRINEAGIGKVQQFLDDAFLSIIGFSTRGLGSESPKVHETFNYLCGGD